MGVIKWKEIEDLYYKTMKEILKEFHVKGRMSSYEIAEKIERDTGIPYSYRQIQRWLKKYGLLRTHSQALRHRVLTGRMDYSKRKLDYAGRYIDYDARDKARGYKWAIGLKRRLRHRGDTLRLARSLGGEDIDVSDWQNLRYRVSPEYQEKVCAYFGVDNNEIFSYTKTRDVPKNRDKYRKHNHRKPLIRRGYLYATNLEDKMYAIGVTKQELADRLNKPLPSISRWAKGDKLVSPTEQARVENILRIPAKLIFTLKRR